MQINGIEIKPGMVLEGTNDDGQGVSLIVAPFKDKNIFINVYEGGWAFNYKFYIKHLTTIRDISERDNLKNGKILWEYKKEIILTIKEIADKFGYDVDQIKIKL